jgi:plasmid stabilization system protein ParE
VSAGRLVISQRARDDLRSIEAYISEHDGEARGLAFAARIEKTMHNVASMPGIAAAGPFSGTGFAHFQYRLGRFTTRNCQNGAVSGFCA